MSKISLEYLAYLTRMAFKFAGENAYHVEPAFSDAAGGTSGDGSGPLKQGSFKSDLMSKATASFMADDAPTHKAERAQDKNSFSRETLLSVHIH